MESGKVAHRRKPTVPVIRPRASEEDQLIHKLSTKSLDLSKVIRLLEDPLTAHLKERHLFVLKKLLKRSQIGFLLKELTDITRILHICAEKTKDRPEYVPVLCEALRICRLPLLKEKASDELSYARDVVDFLSHLGCLMRVNDPDVRQNVVECVKSFYSCVVAKQQLDGTERPSKPEPRTFLSDDRFSRLSLRLQETSPGYRLQLLERSDLARTLLLSMAALEEQPAIRLQLLQTLQILSSCSDRNCASVLRAGGAQTICLHMNQAGPSDQVLIRSTQILLNLLERGSRAEVASQLSGVECLVSLKTAFLESFLRSSLQLTNDLLVITTVVAEDPNSLLIESLFAKELVVLATFPELKSHDSLVQNLKLTFSHEALTMKKLLLNLLAVMSKDSAALQLYKEENVLPALLLLVKPPAASSERRWSSNQQRELQLCALAALAAVAPLALDEFMSYQGNTCLLQLLDWCVGKPKGDPLLSQQDAGGVRGSAGRGGKKAQLLCCIKVLRTVASAGDDSVRQDLCDQGTIGQLLGVLMQVEASEEDEDDAAALELKSDIQLLLSLLCEGDMHRKELFGSEGVEMAVHFLRKGSSKFYSGLGHNKLLLSTVDCVWSCIVGCYTTEDYFLSREGVFLLLNLLSSSPRCVHCNVLATLLELCDNPNTLSHILSWRDVGGQTAPRLLLHLWREEEEELKVSRNAQGGISDPRRPVLCGHQQESTWASLPANEASAAVLELSENLRSKIYSIFCKLGFQDLPGLSTKHYVTLSIVRRYLDFKVGEVWEELSRELSEDGVRPVSPDAAALSAISRISEDTARAVAEEQSAVLLQQEQQEISREELMYSEMKSHWKQQELTAKSWDGFVSRTSDYGVLKEVKAQREKFMESSRAKAKQEDAAAHQAERFVGQVVSVETTGAHGPAGVKLTVARAPIRPVGRGEAAPATQDPEYFSTISVKQ